MPHTPNMTKKRDLPRITLRLPVKHYKSLVYLSTVDKRSVQALAERAVRNYLRSRGVEVGK